MNSLGINKSKDTKVVVAMSGGVTLLLAALMKKRYNVTGITLKLYDDAKSSKMGDNVAQAKIS